MSTDEMGVIVQVIATNVATGLEPDGDPKASLRAIATLLKKQYPDHVRAILEGLEAVPEAALPPAS